MIKKINNNHSKTMLIGILFLISSLGFAQYPGGVSTGTFRGWKVAMYQGYQTNPASFGEGTANATPVWWGYTGRITGGETETIDGDTFALEYTCIFTASTPGIYTFNLNNIDDNAWLYIDGTLMLSGVYPNSSSANITLTAGDHNIKIKFSENGGAQSLFVKVAGPTIASTELDGRLARVDNVKLVAWYNASNINAPGYTVTQFNNIAPDFNTQGHLRKFNSSGCICSSTPSVWNSNYNPGASFDGDDYFSTEYYNQNGLVLRNGSRQQFMAFTPTSNLTGTHWMEGYGGACVNTDIFGFWKTNQTGFNTAIAGSGVATLSTFTAKESKIFSGGISLPQGATASSIPNGFASGNGQTNATGSLTISNRMGPYGIELGAICAEYTNAGNIHEFIYFPFELTSTQTDQVNSYLAIKYGTTLQSNYRNSAGTIVWDKTANATYHNRVIGIAKDATGSLNQKQSKSTMTSTASYNFLTLSKASIALDNVSNTNPLPEGSYVLVGDDNTALTPQNTEIPSSINNGSCNFSRLTREWKSQVTGTPGGLTIRVGSAEVGSFKFTSSMQGIQLMVDEDGDGNFLTGTVTSYPTSSYDQINGVATFSNVILTAGDVFSFVWKQTSPGGVASGLQHWLYANNSAITFSSGAYMSLWPDASPNGRNIKAQGVPTLIQNGLNYNASVFFNGGSYFGADPITNADLTFSSTYTAGDAFGVAQGLSTNSQRGFLWDYGSGSRGSHYTWDDGNIYDGFGTTDRIGYSPTTGTFSDTKVGVSPITYTFDSKNWNLYNHYSGANNWGINVNGNLLAATTTNTTNFSLSTGGIVVGAISGSIWYGNMPEVILYNRVLTATERTKVNSYLGIKYSQALADGSGTSASNYVLSDGTIVWTGNSTYKNKMFGIARDDCSGLQQKQSLSPNYNINTNVRIGLNTIEANGNPSNNAEFGADKNAILMAKDSNSSFFSDFITTNIPATYAAASCNPRRWATNWKVQNTGNVGLVQIIVGATAADLNFSNTMTNPQLAVDIDGDGDFTTGTVTTYTASLVKNGMATFSNVSLPNNAIWTVLWTGSTPGGISKPRTGTTISGQIYVNGLQYTLYSGFDATPEDGLTATLLSKGYVNTDFDSDSFFASKIGSVYSIALKGKLKIDNAGSYSFRFVSVDDAAAVLVDGTVVFHQNFPAGTSATGGVISLTAGYHDIEIRYSDAGGAQTFEMQYKGIDNANAWTQVPDSKYFTTITGPSAWYSSDNNVLSTLSEGGAMSSTIGNGWLDYTENGNHLTSYPGDSPIYYKSTAANLRNYNPVLSFSDDIVDNRDYLNGFAYGKAGKSMFGVQSMYNTPTAEILTAWGRASTGNEQGFYKAANNTLNYFGWGDDFGTATPFWTSGIPKTSIIGTSFQNSNITATNNAKLFGDGLQLTQSTKTGWNTTSSNSVQLSIGYDYGNGNGIGWSGNIYEMGYYPWTLSAAEQLQVNSYLALKWGITLDQTTPSNYTDSDGTVIWNAAMDTNFKYDITGIGRNDCSSLNQKQSTSADGNDIIAMGLNSVVNTNIDNDAMFAQDKSYLVFSHNNAINSFSNYSSLNLPTSLNALGCYVKLNRVWQAQEKGNDVGNLQIKVGKGGTLTFTTPIRPKLIVNHKAAGSSDFTNATIYTPTSVFHGVATFDNVNLQDGDYFTIALVNVAPGGVVNGFSRWFDASSEVYTDNYLTAAEDNDLVKTWVDIAKNGDAFQANTAKQPTYLISSVNYNPTIKYNSAQNLVGGSTNLPTGNGSINFMGVISSNANNPSQWLHSFSYGGEYAGGHVTVSHQLGANNAVSDYFNLNATVINGWLPLGSPKLFIGGNDNTTNTFASINLGTYSFSSSGTINIASSNLYMGSRFSDSNYWNGNISEVILFNRTLTATERLRIASYLGIKYGFTLDGPNTAYKYLAANGTSQIYNYSTHWNRITGIGRDDCGNLDQKQSTSEEPSALITLSTDTVNGVANSNLNNLVDFTDSNSFIVTGDNNDLLKWSAQDLPTSNLQLQRLYRTWRVKETGTVGTIYIDVFANDNTNTYKLPAMPTGNKMYLVVASTATAGVFSSTTGVTVQEMVYNSTTQKWFTTYDFADGDYYTFATERFCISCASESKSLTSWYRPDYLTATSTTATTGVWNDQMGANDLTRTATGTATLNTSNLEAFNYNPFVALTTNATFKKGSLSESNVVSTNQGAMFSVGSTAANQFGLSRSSYNAAILSASGGSWANSAITTAGTFNAGVANFTMLNKTTTNLFGGVNGSLGSVANSTSLVVNSTHQLSIGSIFSASTEVFNNGNFAEAAVFSAGMATPLAQKVDTYLALKYGQTLSHNYFSPLYDGTNAASETLYDISTYGNRVTGIGNDLTGCFTQKQSKSILTGNLLVLNLSNTLATSNATNTAAFNLDRSYLIAGDNNGLATAWSSTWTLTNERPAIYSNDLCSPQRISREWKIAAYGDNISAYIMAFDNTSTNATKLPAVPTGYEVVLLLNDNSDFSVNANQQEVVMTFNASTKTWSTSLTVNKSTTKYYTFVIKKIKCARGCILVNPSTATIRRLN